MPVETMPNPAEPELLLIGEGGIEPAPRIAAGEITEAKTNELVERLRSGEFYDSVEPYTVPNKCVDGRARKDGLVNLGADSSGGSFSVVMGDALTTNRYRAAGEKAPAHAATIYTELVLAGHMVGVHIDDQASGTNCGCGAEDKLDDIDTSKPSILRYIERRSGDIRSFLGRFGISVDDETHQLIADNAAKLIDEKYAINGADLRRAALKIAGPEAIEVLTKGHNELALVINTKAGTTLNRVKLLSAFGEAYQAFNVDLEPIRKAANLSAETVVEADQKFAAMLYYNVATAAVLAGPSMRVVVR